MKKWTNVRISIPAAFSLTEMFCGALPFSGSNTMEIYMAQMQAEPARPSALWPRSGTELETLILTCLKRNRARSASRARRNWPQHSRIEGLTVRAAVLLRFAGFAALLCGGLAQGSGQHPRCEVQRRPGGAGSALELVR